ncbi:MAG: DinB family protein [Candidatus Tectomicrobia bacterium]|nr:DinB family protein [Candidatus Tectomicrobia bacterium]
MPIVNRDCSNDPTAMAELQALGIKALPVSVRGDRVVVGFNIEELKAAFGIGEAARGPLPAGKMLAHYRRVFEAVRRAVRQIPQAQLDWVSPGRKRTLRQLIWHIFERPALCIEACQTGRYTEEMVRRYEAEAEGYRTAEDICGYGERMEARLEEFIGRTPDLLARQVESYMGPITVHLLMEMALGHAVQHLRQTYHYFGLLGIAPDRPLRPEEYAEVPVPGDLF